MLKLVKVIFVIIVLVLAERLVAEPVKETASDGNKAQIAIKVSPDHIILGETAKAHVSASVRDSNGNPLSCEDIRIHASQGDIAKLAQTSKGEYSAQYNLPKAFFPRFAVIAASARCSDQTLSGSRVVKLFGTGTVNLKFNPREEVILEIAKKRFGPHKTDDKGNVKIPIVIPPGVQTGRVGKETIDLNLPPVNRIVAIPEKRGILGGSGEGSAILVFAIDDTTGEPLQKAKLKIKPKRGRILKTVSLAPGVYRAYYKPPADLGYGQDNVTVSLHGDHASETNVAMQLVSGIPAQITFNVHPKTYRAGDKNPLSIAIRVTDKNGNSTASEIEASSDFGQLKNLRAIQPGEYRTFLVLPDHFDGKSTVRIKMHLTKNHNIQAEASVVLTPGDPSSIEFIQMPGLPSQGTSPTDITFRLLDQYGNSISNSEVATSASTGTTPPVATIKGNEYVISFTPPASSAEQEEESTITATIGSARAETTVTLGSNSSVSTNIKSKSYFMGLTPEVGFLTNVGNVHAPLLTLPIDWHLSFVEGLHLGVDLGYFYYKGNFDSEDYHSTLHGIVFGGFLGYRIKITPKLFLSPIAECGGLMLGNVIKHEDVNLKSESALQLYARGAIELGHQAGPGHIVMRADYMYAKADKLDLFRGRIGGLNFQFGYRIEFL